MGLDSRLAEAPMTPYCESSRAVRTEVEPRPFNVTRICIEKDSICEDGSKQGLATSGCLCTHCRPKSQAHVMLKGVLPGLQNELNSTITTEPH